MLRFPFRLGDFWEPATDRGIPAEGAIVNVGADEVSPVRGRQRSIIAIRALEKLLLVDAF